MVNLINQAVQSPDQFVFSEIIKSLVALNLMNQKAIRVVKLAENENKSFEEFHEDMKQ